MSTYEWVEECQADPYIVWWWRVTPDVLNGETSWWIGAYMGTDVDWTELPLNWEIM